MFLNNQQGGFEDVTADLWPASENLGKDDNMVVFIDSDSDGDADILIGSLDGPDRLMINYGTGHLQLDQHVFAGKDTLGTLGLAIYGEYLWRATIDDPSADDFSFQVCATDAAGNEACSSP